MYNRGMRKKSNPTFMTKMEKSNSGSVSMRGYSPLKARPPKLCAAKGCTNKRYKQGYCRKHGAEKLAVRINKKEIT
jgi:hypothetical protein